VSAPPADHCPLPGTYANPVVLKPAPAPPITSVRRRFVAAVVALVLVYWSVTTMPALGEGPLTTDRLFDTVTTARPVACAVSTLGGIGGAPPTVVRVGSKALVASTRI
jgi:hypothetical protein